MLKKITGAGPTSVIVVFLGCFVFIAVGLFSLKGTYTWFTHKAAQPMPLEIGVVKIGLKSVDVQENLVEVQLENESNTGIYLRASVIPVILDEHGVPTSDDIRDITYSPLSEGWEMKTYQDGHFRKTFIAYTGDGAAYAIYEAGAEETPLRIRFEFDCALEEGRQIGFYIVPEAIQGTEDALTFFSGEDRAWPWS